MEGRARAAQRSFEFGLSQAWHTEAFAREKRLKPLAKYIGKAEKTDQSRGGAMLYGTLIEMQARGVPMTIRRVKLRRPRQAAAGAG